MFHFQKLSKKTFATFTFHILVKNDYYSNTWVDLTVFGKQFPFETISCKFLCLPFSIWSWIILTRETEDKIINTYPTNPSASIGICNCRAIITDCCCVTYKESPWKTIQYLSNSETAKWKALFGRKFSYLFLFWTKLAQPASRPVSCCCACEDERELVVKLNHSRASVA